MLSHCTLNHLVLVKCVYKTQIFIIKKLTRFCGKLNLFFFLKDCFTKKDFISNVTINNNTFKTYIKKNYSHLMDYKSLIQVTSYKLNEIKSFTKNILIGMYIYKNITYSSI